MAKTLKLWDYQLPSVEALRQGFRDGHRSQILMAPTGFGKTIVAAHLLDLAAKHGKRAAILVDRVNLVDQTSQTLDEYGIAHGVIQAKHWRRRLYEPIQVCSAQTIEKREFFPDLDLLIVDECHAIRADTAKFIKSRPKLKVIGLSATPFTKGLADLYTNLVNVCSTNQLLASGDLVPLKVYAAVPIDMTGAKVEDGEWTSKDAGERGLKIVGDIVTEWQNKTLLHFGRAVKTIVFAASVAHGAELCRQFNEAGYNFQQVSYRDRDDGHRKELIEEFRKPDSEITGLVSCEVFTKGFDVKDILCGIAARPYRKSLSGHIQQMGRCMRPYEGKEFALWLDHSGNYLRFREDVEDVFEHGLRCLADGQKHDAVARSDPSEAQKEQWSCSCGFVFPRRLDVCPACGKEHIRKSMVENVAGVMEAVGHSQPSAKKLPKYLQDKDSAWRQLCYLARQFKKNDFEAGRRFAQAQFNNLYGHFCTNKYSATQPEEISSSLKRRVLTDLKKYRERQKREVAHA